MSSSGTQEIVAQTPIRVARIEIRPVAAYRIASAGIGAVAASGTCIPSDVAPLGMVENVEGFCAELQRDTFVDSEVLEDCHVEIRLTRIPGNIPW